MNEIKLFINGEFRNSSDGKTFESSDPCNGELVAKCHLPSKKDIDDAVNSAHNAFYNNDWKSMTQDKRSELLLAISDKMKERKKEFIDLEMRDSGSLLRKVKADVHTAITYFKVMSKMAKNLKLEELDENSTREGFSKNSRTYQPIGVCAQIIPWNFPLVMASWKIGPILATGCTTVIKSASETPGTAALLAEIFQEVGVPKGVINVITGGAEEGKYLIENKKISKIAFTGSTEVGKNILKTAANRITNTTLELGGKSANIVLEDADLDIAIDGAIFAFLFHAGQACDSGTRLLVHEKIYEEFKTRLINRIGDLKIGPTNDIASSFGPVINEKQFNSIMSFIEKTKSEGANLLTGGNRVIDGDLSKGFYIAPTVFEVTPDNTIFHEEIFGPVLGMTKFLNDEEAVLLANNSHYGLAGAVWSKDHKRAKEIAKKIEAGTVWINEYHLLNPGMPFGGFKQSGIGREMGLEGILAYMEVKHIWESDCNQRSDKPWLDSLF
jgi:acyl-CoA reductase-like NAD-dependent aldehyde dehydrogenase